MTPEGARPAPQPQPSNLLGPYLGDAAADYRHSGVQNAAVYFYSNGTHLVVRSDSRQGNRVLRWRKATAISLVALGRHHTRVEQQLPAMRGSRYFRAELDVVWEVTDPARVAEKQLRDVRILLPELLHRLRGITSRYLISDPSGAMTEINRFLDTDARASISADYGLDVRVYVQLNLDDAAIKGIGQLDEDEWQAQLEEKRRLRLLRTLDGGGLERAAALTAQDPAQLATAIKMLTESEKAERKQIVEFFQYLLDSGAITRAQVGPQAQAILGWVRGGGDPAVPYSIDWKLPDDDDRTPPRRAAIEDSPRAPQQGRPRSTAPRWLEEDADFAGESESTPEPARTRPRTHREEPDDFRAEPARTRRRTYREEREQAVDDDRSNHRGRSPQNPDPVRTVEVIEGDLDWHTVPRTSGSRAAARDDDWADNDVDRARGRTSFHDEGDW